MSRTTLNIDTPILMEIRTLQRREGKPLGKLVSELLSEALAVRSKRKPAQAELRWISKPMRARVELSDKEALYAILDRDRPGDERVGNERAHRI